MTSFRVRPRFKYLSSLSIEEIEEKIKRDIENVPDCYANFIPGNIKLKINQKYVHYWSPQLDITLEKSDEEEHEGTIIRGLYGPNPKIWTAFMFAYGALGTLLLFVSLFAFSKIGLGQKAPIVWAIPVIAGLMFGLYIISQMGQKIGADQTYTLHHFFEDCIDHKVRIK